MSSQQGVTQLLAEATAGDQGALDVLFERVYGELRALAGNYLQNEREGHTLQATALVHEAYLRIVGQQNIEWQNRAHFFSIAAKVMRNILVDSARAHRADKRGGGTPKISLEDAVSFATEHNVDLVALDEALNRLAEIDSQRSKIVELRYFGGFTIEETASILDLSVNTVSRKWETAKLWLHGQLDSTQHA